MTQVKDVLIVGGGIAGLTLAAALQQRGLNVELVERSAVWQAVGAGILIQANGMRALRAVGLDAAVERAGVAVPGWSFCDQDGAVLCETDLEMLWRGVGPCIGIARTTLQDALRAGAAAVPCRLGTWPVGLVQDARRVAVEFNDGSAGEYDLVVGADGIGSSVRRLGISNVELTYSGQLAWRTLGPAPASLTNVEFALGDGCFYGLLPVGNGRAYGFGNVTTTHFYDPLDGRLDRLRRRFAQFGGRVAEHLAALERDEQIHCSAIEWVELHEWHRGRVLLIGDAAHATSPMMGQGGCMAMEDAELLAAALRSEANVEDAIGAYEERRRPRVSWVQQESRAVGEALRAPPAVRDAALRERGDAMFRKRFGPLVPAA